MYIYMINNGVASRQLPQDGLVLLATFQDGLGVRKALLDHLEALWLSSFVTIALNTQVVGVVSRSGDATPEGCTKKSTHNKIIPTKREPKGG